MEPESEPPKAKRLSSPPRILRLLKCHSQLLLQRMQSHFVLRNLTFCLDPPNQELISTALDLIMKIGTMYMPDDSNA